MVVTPQIGDLQSAGDGEGVMNIKYEIENGLNYGTNGYVNMNNDMVRFQVCRYFRHESRVP